MPCDLLGKLLSLSNHSTGSIQQCGVSRTNLCLPLLVLFYCGWHGRWPEVCKRSVAQLSSGSTDYCAYPLHDAREYPHSMARRAAIDGIVDVRLHDSRTNAESAGRRDLRARSARLASVFQGLVGTPHPRLPQVVDGLRDQPVGKAPLKPPRGNRRSGVL